jgi:hypothetical protein
MPPQRGQGQWALGHREPLNQNERVKRDDDGPAAGELQQHGVRTHSAMIPVTARWPYATRCATVVA